LRPLGMVRADLRDALQRALGTDKLSHRGEGWSRKRVARRWIEIRYSAAKFKRAIHGHSVDFVLVPEGDEGCHSEVTKAWPNEVGLPSSYKFPVSKSSHVVRYSVAILRAPRPSHHCLPLSPYVTITQGRGSSLTVTRKGGE
jgi:hypothetical protein